ncbi:MAG TPA: class I SAM-dependent methyltransferase, partial [Nitrososphaeraceae archaeon]|nr:class I SAM-dependent methyltransferase [Nitrososphaeraceae archaeon]
IAPIHEPRPLIITRSIAVDVKKIPLLSVAKQRATSLGLQNVIEYKERDTETIDLPTSTFDAVLSRWGITLFLDFDTVYPIFIDH